MYKNSHDICSVVAVSKIVIVIIIIVVVAVVAVVVHSFVQWTFYCLLGAGDSHLFV